MLEEQGALGRYGFHEALDYTRPDPGERSRWSARTWRTTSA